MCVAAATCDLSTAVAMQACDLVTDLCPGTLHVKLVVWQLMLHLDGGLHFTHAMSICLQL